MPRQDNPPASACVQRTGASRPGYKFMRIHFLVAVLGLVLCVILFRANLRSAGSSIQLMKSSKSVSERVMEFGEAVHNRLAVRFREGGAAYPPKQIILVGLKQERALEVWASAQGGELRHLKTYPILGASGTLGPKLAEGDAQVPEGLYSIES